jgi:hypothetical protein
MSEQQSPVAQAIIAQTQAIMEDAEKRMTDRLRATELAAQAAKEESRQELANTLQAIAAGMPGPVQASILAALNADASAPAVQAISFTLGGEVKDEPKRTVRSRVSSMFSSKSPARQVGFTKNEALADLKKDEPSEATLEVAERGLQSLGIRHAFETGLVQAPRRGIQTWHVVAAVATMAVATGVGVAAYDVYKSRDKKDDVNI